MAQAQFEAAVATWFKGYLTTHPVRATALGIHDHDHRLADQLPVVRSALEALAPLEIPADESAATIEADPEEQGRVLFPGTLRHGSGLSAIELSRSIAS